LIFNLIDKPDDLEFLNQELLQSSHVGVDTEFRRTTKDNMKLSLIQVNDGEEIYLIDCLQIDYKEENCNFLFSKDVIKIFHSCKEDLEAVFSWTGQNLVNIFDTQLANAFLGGSYSIGYQDLVIDKIDVKVDKDETRSNWLRRPLTDSQLRYAASDVEFLSDLYMELEEKLISENKIDWFYEEITSIIDLKSYLETDSRDQNQILSKALQGEFLDELNCIVESLAQEKEVNKTLLFSKKSQKLLLHKILNSNLEEALDNLTTWRKDLISNQLNQLSKAYDLI
tara:strand:- start:1337 stop:2182 length:846 start_codon:yes stop_codon:yes gene_type:complete